MIAISIALDNGIFLNRLVTSNEIKNLSVTLTDLISSINVKLSFVEYSDVILGERREPKYWARLQLQVPIEERIGRKGGKESGKKALCILGVP